MKHTYSYLLFKFQKKNIFKTKIKNQNKKKTFKKTKIKNQKKNTKQKKNKKKLDFP